MVLCSAVWYDVGQCCVCAVVVVFCWCWDCVACVLVLCVWLVGGNLVVHRCCIKVLFWFDSVGSVVLCGPVWWFYF